SRPAGSRWRARRRWSLASLLPPLRRGAAQLFASLDVGPRRDPRDRLADHIEWQVLELLETYARLSHVELLPARGVRLAKPCSHGAVAVDAHQVKRHVVLLRREMGERQRLLRIA